MTKYQVYNYEDAQFWYKLVAMLPYWSERIAPREYVLVRPNGEAVTGKKYDNPYQPWYDLVRIIPYPLDNIERLYNAPGE